MLPTAGGEAPIDFRRQPRKRRPSERNFAIHEAYRAGLRTQGQLAVEFGLPQTCISRIVRQVDRWLTAHGTRAALDPAEQARVEWQLEVQRVKGVFESALRCHDAMPGAVCSTRNRSARSGELVEEIRREIAPDAQWLKVALQASEQLDRLLLNPPDLSRGSLRDRQPSSEAGVPSAVAHASRMGEGPSKRDACSTGEGSRRNAPPAGDRAADVARMMQTLCALRREAEDAGQVPRSDVEATVAAMVFEFLGLATGGGNTARSKWPKRSPPQAGDANATRDLAAASQVLTPPALGA